MGGYPEKRATSEKPFNYSYAYFVMDDQHAFTIAADILEEMINRQRPLATLLLCVPGGRQALVRTRPCGVRHVAVSDDRHLRLPAAVAGPDAFQFDGHSRKLHGPDVHFRFTTSHVDIRPVFTVQRHA